MLSSSGKAPCASVGETRSSIKGGKGCLDSKEGSKPLPSEDRFSSIGMQANEGVDPSCLVDCVADPFLPAMNFTALSIYANQTKVIPLNEFIHRVYEDLATY
jgi:hypothetical protein